MGKKRETSTEEEIPQDGDLSVVAVKKHKKHKHKKHKRKKTDQDSEGYFLKMAVLNPTEEDLDVFSASISDPKPALAISTSPSKGSVKKKKKGKESATSSEEERWLDAIESGKLEEVDDELKKIKHKDPKLMTARQRAMLERKTTDKEPCPGGEPLVALPTGYREKIMTPEMALKAALKSQRRKQQADEKREKDKKKTMERLLRKQESKAGKLSTKGRAVKRSVPTAILSYTTSGISVSLPLDVDFPLLPAKSKNPPVVQTCGVDGCFNPKKYSCSQTFVPLCSLACYRRNLLDFRET